MRGRRCRLLRLLRPFRKRSEDNGFSQPMPKTLEDLGQSVLCQHFHCIQEENAQIPRNSSPANSASAATHGSTQSRNQGSKPKALSTRWDTAQDADQWSSRKNANSLALWNIGAVSARRRKLSNPLVLYMVCRLRATHHARRCRTNQDP